MVPRSLAAGVAARPAQASRQLAIDFLRIAESQPLAPSEPAIDPASPKAEPAIGAAAEPAPAEPTQAQEEAPADPSAVSADDVPDDANATPSTTVPARPDAHEIIDTNAPRLLTEQEPTQKKIWEQQNGGFTASRLAIQRRLRDYPTRLLVPRSGLPRQMRAFLRRTAEDTWRGLMALTDYESGLPVDHVRFEGSPLPPLAAHIGDYVNVTSIGLQLACIAAARAIDLIGTEAAQFEAAKILDTLGHLERHEGQFYNYYDTTSLEATSTFLSFVDTAWLVAGLIVTRQAFPELAPVVNEILDSIDLGYFYDRTTRQMSHGYYVNKGVLSVYTYGAFYTEARLGSLIAIGKGDAPVNHWYAMKRAMKPRCSDGNCPTTHELAYTARDGRTMRVTTFRWQGRQYVPSWGGSMFEALMPRLVLDEERYAPRSLGPNGEAHAMIQQEYAREVLGFPVWGMSPSSTPSDGRYGEFGVPVLGSHGYAAGIVTPHAAALALAVAPDDAADNLMDMARRYDIYGEYGFYDAVDPGNGQVGYSLLQLDQAMLFLSVANHLSQNAVPRLFAADPYIKPALALLGEERFFE
ncbi:MAG TPA: glucoamylase family protein [Candidatus Limnocylindrales bacterium]|nr:glucoamylase family protein [Candidatus Limnocylindrales bacterium]